MKDDMISRQAALAAICEDGTQLERQGQYSMTMAERKQRDADILSALPSAQPETAKRIVGKSRNGMTLWYQCEMCNEPVDAQDNFCRGCGRRLTDG